MTFVTEQTFVLLNLFFCTRSLRGEVEQSCSGQARVEKHTTLLMGDWTGQRWDRVVMYHFYLNYAFVLAQLFSLTLMTFAYYPLKAALLFSIMLLKFYNYVMV